MIIKERKEIGRVCVRECSSHSLRTFQNDLPGSPGARQLQGWSVSPGPGQEIERAPTTRE